MAINTNKSTYRILSTLPFWVLILLGLSLSSCGDNYVYEKQYVIQNGAWGYGDTLDFDFEIQDTTSIYNLYLEVAHNKDYSFQNLYTTIHTKFPGGELLDEVLSLELAGKGGNWLGDCGKEACSLKIPIQQNAYFNANGAYKITLKQHMRKNPIEGINSISFLLEKTKSSR